jgi:uncharacterized spore protein YtfJ
MAKQSDPEEARSPIEAGAVERAAAAFERILGAGDVAKVYGKPVQKGEATIIPAAEILAIGGFGAGGGSGTDLRSNRRGGGGGGGGGSVLALSVAVIVATPEGVRVEPVVDFTKIALAALTAAGFVIAAWSGMSRTNRRFR